MASQDGYVKPRRLWQAKTIMASQDGYGKPTRLWQANTVMASQDEHVRTYGRHKNEPGQRNKAIVATHYSAKL